MKLLLLLLLLLEAAANDEVDMGTSSNYTQSKTLYNKFSLRKNNFFAKVLMNPVLETYCIEEKREFL